MAPGSCCARQLQLWTLMKLLFAAAYMQPVQSSIAASTRNLSKTLTGAIVHYSSPYCSCASPDPVPLRNGAATLTSTSELPGTPTAKPTHACSLLPVVPAGKECGAAIGICSPVSKVLGSAISCQGLSLTGSATSCKLAVCLQQLFCRHPHCSA